MDIEQQYNGLLQRLVGGEAKRKYDKSREIDTSHISKVLVSHWMGNGFPALRGKKIHLKSVFSELAWFIRGDANITFLEKNGCRIWRKDALNYARKKLGHELEMDEMLDSLGEPSMDGEWRIGDLGPVYGKQWRDFGGEDQLSELIKGLLNNPLGRRHRVSAWNPSEIPDMALPPCHVGFDVITYKEHGNISFDLCWEQRSVDTFLGLPFNIASYAALGILISALTGYNFNMLYGSLSNVHLYDNHREQAIKQLDREFWSFEYPEVKLSRNFFTKCMKVGMDNGKGVEALFDNIEPEVFKVYDYTSFPAISAEMVAPKNI